MTMKNYLLNTFLLFCFILQFLISCAEPEPTKDKNGILLFENLKTESKKPPMFFKGEKYTGAIVKYYGDGTLEFEGSYEEGVKIGPWKYYHEDGKLKREETAQPSEGDYHVKTYRRRNGILYTELIGKGEDTIHFKKYHHNGTLGQELKNDGKRLFQKWTSFGKLYHYDSEDSIVYTMNTKTKEFTHKGLYENGKKTGFWFKHYRNGNKQYEKTYVSGKLVGKAIEYYHNGNIERIWNYNELGLLEGEYLSYRFDGSLFVSGQYDHLGKKTGIWLYYNASGQRTGLKNYKLNQLNGYYEDYNSYGVIREKGYYQNNRRVGIWYYYDKYGRLLREVDEGESS